MSARNRIEQMIDHTYPDEVKGFVNGFLLMIRKNRI